NPARIAARNRRPDQATRSDPDQVDREHQRERVDRRTQIENEEAGPQPLDAESYRAGDESDDDPDLERSLPAGPDSFREKFSLESDGAERREEAHAGRDQERGAQSQTGDEDETREGDARDRARGVGRIEHGRTAAGSLPALDEPPKHRESPAHENT